MFIFPSIMTQNNLYGGKGMEKEDRLKFRTTFSMGNEWGPVEEGALADNYHFHRFTEAKWSPTLRKNGVSRFFFLMAAEVMFCWIFFKVRACLKTQDYRASQRENWGVSFLGLAVHWLKERRKHTAEKPSKFPSQG